MDEDWPDRLDALAPLRTEPRPGVITMLPIIAVPRLAGPALFRLLMAHGVDERDWLVRQSAANLRGLRRPDPADDVELVDWDARRSRPELFRWVLELMGEAGDRPLLVAAAVRAGAVPAPEGDWLAAPVERPAWADGEVPWEVDEVVTAGEVIVPSGRLTGGDPWSMYGNVPWMIAIPPGRYPVRFVIGTHPLAGRECAALHLVVDPNPLARRRASPRATHFPCYTHPAAPACHFDGPCGPATSASRAVLARPYGRAEPRSGMGYPADRAVLMGRVARRCSKRPGYCRRDPVGAPSRQPL